MTISHGFILSKIKKETVELLLDPKLMNRRKLTNPNVLLFGCSCGGKRIASSDLLIQSSVFSPKIKINPIDLSVALKKEYQGMDEGEKKLFQAVQEGWRKICLSEG